MKKVFRRFWSWFKKEVLRKDMIVFVIISLLIFWSPVIIGFIGGFANKWFYGVAVAYIAFWAGPFTPAIPLQIGLALVLKKIYYKIIGKGDIMEKDFKTYLKLEDKAEKNGLEALSSEELDFVIETRKADTDKALESVKKEPTYFINDKGGSSLKLEETEHDKIEVVLRNGKVLSLEEFYESFEDEENEELIYGVSVLIKSLVTFDLWDKDNGYKTKLIGERYVVNTHYKLAEVTSIAKSFIEKG